MKSKHAKKVSTIIIGVVAALFCVLSVHAQDLKSIFLKPSVWVGEWSHPRTGDTGKTEIAPESRGEKVVAKLNITEPGRGTMMVLNCERDIKISADTIKFDSCNDQFITLIFDPNDKVHPFKSKDETMNGYKWKLREK